MAVTGELILKLPQSCHAAIIEHARSGMPDEICGILEGNICQHHHVIRRVHPTTNVAADPASEYRIDPTEQLDIFEAIEARGQDIVGFYHSHPRGPATPSSLDEARATWPDRSYLIISLAQAEPSVRSWRWIEGAFVPETLDIVP